MSHGGSIFVAQCKLLSYVIRQRFDILSFERKVFAKAEMPALERIDMLRQLIEMFRRANFSENTSFRGNVVIQ